MPTTVQGLALVATLAASGASAAGQALDRYGGRLHGGGAASQSLGSGDALAAPNDPAAGARFYALHSDYGLTPDLLPARPATREGAPGTEIPRADLPKTEPRGPTDPDALRTPPAPDGSVKPASSPSDF